MLKLANKTKSSLRKSTISREPKRERYNPPFEIVSIIKNII